MAYTMFADPEPDVLTGETWIDRRLMSSSERRSAVYTHLAIVRAKLADLDDRAAAEGLLPILPELVRVRDLLSRDIRTIRSDGAA